jgi:hypothetical protein
MPDLRPFLRQVGQAVGDPQLPGPLNAIPRPIRAGLGVVGPLVPGLGALASPGGQVGQALAGKIMENPVGNAVSGEGLYAIARIVQAARAASGPDTPSTPMSILADQIVAQGAGHPIRIQQMVEHSPNPIVSKAAGAQAMVFDPANFVGAAGEGAQAAKLGRVGDLLAAVDRAQNAPIEALGGLAKAGSAAAKQRLGPETIHPGEDVHARAAAGPLRQTAPVPQSPPASTDRERDRGDARPGGPLAAERAYGDQWQNRLAALTGGKWGQPGSGARLVNGRVMLGDLDLTTPLRDYLENRGGAQAGDFKGAIKALLPGKAEQIAPGATPAVQFTGTLDDVRNLILGGDKGNMGGYAPADPAFYQKRANVDPAQVPAMLDQLVQEGTLGRLPDGSLGIKPAQAPPCRMLTFPRRSPTRPSGRRGRRATSASPGPGPTSWRRATRWRAAT